MSVHACTHTHAYTCTHAYTQGDSLRDDAQMSVGEWITFCRHVGLLESGQLTTLTAKYIFIWSRIRTAQDLSDASEVKLRNLTYTDFMEVSICICICICIPDFMEVSTCSHHAPSHALGLGWAGLT